MPIARNVLLVHLQQRQALVNAHLVVLANMPSLLVQLRNVLLVDLVLMQMQRGQSSVQLVQKELLLRLMALRSVNNATVDPILQLLALSPVHCALLASTLPL